MNPPGEPIPFPRPGPSTATPVAAPEPSGGLPVELTGLAFGCPFSDENSACPFHGVRLDEPAARVRWLRALAPQAQVDLARHHADCCRRRLAPESP